MAQGWGNEPRPCLHYSYDWLHLGGFGYAALCGGDYLTFIDLSRKIVVCGRGGSWKAVVRIEA
jgi:hypothetical protein